MSIGAYGDDALHKLAQAMAAAGHQSVAVALRKLAHEGYTSLEQVDNASDWVLLSIRGIGVGRLGEVRRLTRPDWQPPSPQAVQAGNRFLCAAQFALRYWPPKTLAPLIRDSTARKVGGETLEKQIALDVFAQAVRRAARYCDADELAQALGSIGNGQAKDAYLAHESSYGYDSTAWAWQNGTVEMATPGLRFIFPDDHDAAQDSDRFAHPRHKRFDIVQDYWAARERGEVQNKDAWARSRYHISGKTLLCYEREFQDQREAVLAAVQST
jgi:hypothetical protein